MTDLAEELRIIARDGGRLDGADRAKIAQLAEEFEATQRELVATNIALIEANAHRIALNDRLINAEKLARARQDAATARASYGTFVIPLPWWGRP